MLSYLKRFVQDRSAVAALEFALVFPLMLTLWMGSVSVAHAVRADMDVYNAAELVANMTANQVTSTVPNTLTSICDGAKFALNGFSTSGGSGQAGNLTVAIADVYNNSVVTQTVPNWFTNTLNTVPSYTVNWMTGFSADTCTASNSITVALPAPLTTAAPTTVSTTYYTPLIPNPTDSVIVVQVTYKYQFLSLFGITGSSLFYIFPTSYTFTQTAYSRPRNGANGIQPTS